MSSCFYTEGQTRIHETTISIPALTQLLESKKREVIIKEIFDETTQTKFRIKIQFIGHNNDIAEIFYLSPTPLFIKSVLTIILRRESRNIVTTEYETIPAHKWQYMTTLFKRDILHDQEIFLVRNTLELKFQFKVTNDIQITQLVVPEAQLSNDFENLLKGGLFSDVVMRSCEQSTFNAHKAVLASRSAVLRAMFEHDMAERRTDSVESPFDSAVLEQVLVFMYSDRAPAIDAMPDKLLAAADYYQLSGLKALCEQALHKRLTVDNCLDTLKLAESYSANDLKQMVLEFIKDGHAKLITQTESWTKIESVDAIKTIYSYLMNEEVDVDIK